MGSLLFGVAGKWDSLARVLTRWVGGRVICQGSGGLLSARWPGTLSQTHLLVLPHGRRSPAELLRCGWDPTGAPSGAQQSGGPQSDQVAGVTNLGPCRLPGCAC